MINKTDRIALKTSFTIFCLALLLENNNVKCSCLCPSYHLTKDSIHVSNVDQLQQALQKANQQNGNLSIVLEKGVYDLTSNLLFISSNMVNLNITSTEKSRNDVIIKGQGFSGVVTHIFNVAAANFQLSNLTIGWVSQHPIQIHGESGANYPQIFNVKIVDGNEQFIKISANLNTQNECIGGIIRCCEFVFSKGIANQFYTGGIDGHRCNDWLIQSNNFSGIRSPDGNLAEHAIHFWSNSKNIIVENNEINNCDRGIGFGLSDDPTRGNVGGIIRNNFVHTNRDVGIGIENSPNTKIYNNTVWTENYYNSIEYRFVRTTEVDIKNNLTNKSIRSRDEAQANVSNNYESATSDYFIDGVNYDFHLSLMAVEAIDKGMTLQDVSQDIDCENRSDQWDLGADEYETISNAENPKLDFEEINVIKNVILLNNPISGAKHLELLIFDLQGREVLKLLNNEIPSQIILPDAPGIYFILLKKDRRRILKKFVIIQ